MKKNKFRMLVAFVVTVVALSSCGPMHHGQRDGRGNGKGQHGNGQYGH